ncbi:29762_t:CDS:2, partial [Gigaspora margarita]
NKNDDVVLMKDMRKIVAYWSENQAPPKDLIHVIVEALGGSVPNRAGDRTSLINASLTRKLPVSFYEEIKFTQLVDFIETKNDECGSNISKHISHVLTDIVEKQNLNNTLEDMLYWEMDSIFRIQIQIFLKNLDGGILPIEMDQNSEEKTVIEDFSKANNELEEKFNKFYPISQNTNPPSSLIALSNQLDMNNRRDRVSILKKRVSVEYIPFAGNLDDCINFLSKFSKEARAMSQSVLTGLNWLHKGGYVHRDIRLPNLLFIPGDEDCKYVLNDFEHANVDGLVTTERLKDWDNKTLTKLQHNLICINLERSYIVNSEAGKKFLDGLR